MLRLFSVGLSCPSFPFTDFWWSRVFCAVGFCLVFVFLPLVFRFTFSLITTFVLCCSVWFSCCLCCLLSLFRLLKTSRYQHGRVVIALSHTNAGAEWRWTEGRGSALESREDHALYPKGGWAWVCLCFSVCFVTATVLVIWWCGYKVWVDGKNTDNNPPAFRLQWMPYAPIHCRRSERMFGVAKMFPSTFISATLCKKMCSTSPSAPDY